jgi:MGT family glycosyltransferase
MNKIMTETPRRFLFVLWEGGGNVPPVLGLARRLVARGHSARVISDPTNESEARHAGCEFTSYTRAPHRYDKSAASTIVNDYDGQNPTQQLFIYMDKILSGPALSYAQDVLDELEKRPADAVVVSEGLFGGCFAAEKAGIPSVMVIPSGFNYYAPGMPPPGMLPLSGPGGWLRDKVFSIMFRRLTGYASPGLQSARQALGLPEAYTFSQILSQLNSILLLTSSSFDFPAQLPRNVRYVGPVLDDPVLTEPWHSPWSDDDQRPLIVVGFSTTYQKQENLLQKVMDALGGLPYRGLVTLGPSLDAKQFRSPSNVFIQQFISHAQVFPHTAAVITHAGHGTVIRALAHGLPLLCIPLARDQPSNAARVIAHGVGLQLTPEANVKTIRSTLQQVIETPRYRENADRLAKIIQEDARSSRAVEELEQIANLDQRVMHPTV